MSYAEQLRSNYGEVHKRLWKMPKPVQPPPMEYSGQASGNMWQGLDRDMIDFPDIRGADIVKAVLSVMHVRRIDFLSRRRYRQYSEARQVACWFMRQYTRLSSPQIGKIVGGRDHTTVLHAVKQVNNNPDRFTDVIEKVAKALGVPLPNGVPFQ